MPYNSKQDAVSALLPGYRVVGEAPYTVKVANPKAGLAGEPAQIDQQAGVTLSVQGPDGTPDTIVVKEVGNNPNTKGGVGYDVITGPSKAPVKTATPAAGLERLDAKGQAIPAGDTTTPTVYLRDPKAPAGTQPFKVEGDLKTDPSTWTPITDPNDKSDNPRVIGLWDPTNNKVGASVSAPAGAKASDPSKWQPIYRTPGDSSSGIVGQWDPTNNELHAVSAAPDGTQIVTTPTAIYVVDKDTGKSTKVQDVTPGDVNKQAVTVGGKVYTFDPKDGSFTLPTNVQTAATVGNSTTLKDLIWYDDQGNEVGRQPNPNYGKAPVTAPTPNTVAPYIQVPDPQNPSQLIWIENKGQVTASDALKQLASHLSGQVVDGKISVDEAKALIDASNAKMTADTAQQTNVTTAAGDILSNTRGNAQTAGAMLQQRVQAATGTLQSILGNALSNKNITSVPSDVGANLVGGLQGWTADLMGGQNTLDSAARMVQMADPSSNLADPTTQAAIATLHQMLDKYQDVTGQAHPIVQATQAAGASQQAGGMAAPQTLNAGTNLARMNVPSGPNAQGFNPQGSTAALNAQGFQDTPEGRAAAIAAGQGNLLQTPQPVAAPVTHAPSTYGIFSGAMPSLATPSVQATPAVAGFQAPVYPWLASPQPAFMAPVTG
jgi:hypothetical protein